MRRKKGGAGKTRKKNNPARKKRSSRLEHFGNRRLAAPKSRQLTGSFKRNFSLPGNRVRTPQKYAYSLPAHLESRLPIFIAIAFCLAFALLLGALESEFRFQKTDAHMSWMENCSAQSRISHAFASGGGLLLPLAHGQNSSSFASFSGLGKISWVTIDFDEAGAAVSSLRVNGKLACSPCNAGRRYPLEIGEAHGILVAAEAVEVNAPAAEARANIGSSIGAAFFEKASRTRIEAPLEVSIGGGWQAGNNAAMPSSFYGVDAPFHISRIPLLAEYLVRLEWPWDHYSFLSAAPPALLYAATGMAPQYAYKLYEIALFFVPVVLFYFFSRKLSSGANAAFLFASLLYLCLPANGLVTGGGPDLFLYGMTAHTLATYLSLVFFYFAYEFAVEGRGRSLLPAVAAFAAAFASNLRILFALCAILGVVCIPPLARLRLRKPLVLGVACFAAIAWMLVPYVLGMNLGGYAPLGGVKVRGQEQGLLAVLGAGYLLLPLLAVAGAYCAYARREWFAGLLIAAGALVFVAGTNPQINQLFPFIDGLRFLPSFFLPMFFLAGIGAHFAWSSAREIALRAAAARGIDCATAAGAFALALLLPAAAVFSVAASTTAEQYSSASGSLRAAADYSSLERIGAITGEGRVLFISDSMVSQYPVFGNALRGNVVVDFEDASALANRMEGCNARHAILGSSKTLGEAGGKSRQQDYLAIASDPRFEEILVAGSSRLFVLHGESTGSDVVAHGASVSASEVRLDRAAARGTCFSENCSVVFFSSLPASSECLNRNGSCSVSSGACGSAVVSGMAQGGFDIEVTPKHQGYELLLAAGGLAVLAACILVSKD